MLAMSAKASNPLETETDRLLQIWIREYGHRATGYPRSSSGVIALTETKGYRSKRRRKEIASARVHATETRSASKRSAVYVNQDAEKVEAIMVKLKRVHLWAYLSLSMHYQGFSYREIGQELSTNHTQARKYKETGFSMVMMELN